MTPLLLFTVLVAQPPHEGPHEPPYVRQEGVAAAPGGAQRACVARQRSFAPAASEAFLQLKCRSASVPSAHTTDGGEPGVAAAGGALVVGDPVDRQSVRARLFRGAGASDGRGWVDERAGWRRTISRAVPITTAVLMSTALIGLSPVALPAVWVAGHWLSPPGSGLGPVVAMGGAVLLGITQAAIGLTAAGAGLYVGHLRRSLEQVDEGEHPRLHRPGTLVLSGAGDE